MSSRHAATRTDPVLRSLRADILTGVLPPSTPLRIAALSEQFGVSYSVIREALLRLAGQGLTRAVPQKGFIVTPISRADLLELTQVRLLVECEALAESIRDGDVAWESEVAAAMHRLRRVSEEEVTPAISSEEWVQAHSEFHHSLIAACTNGRLLEMATHLRDSAEMYRQLSQAPAVDRPAEAPAPALAPAGPAPHRDLVAEHQNLADLTIERDSAAAVAALRDHIRTTTDLTLTRFFAV